MAIISFEHIAPDGQVAVVPDGFRRLDWDVFVALDDEFLETFMGNSNAIRTGEAAAVGDPDGGAVGFHSPDRDNDFDLNSGYFTAAAENNLQVKIVGFDDGKKVATKVLTLDADQENADQEFIRFGPQFDGIDEVKFTVIGGTNPDPSDFQPIFGVDDLFLNL